MFIVVLVYFLYVGKYIHGRYYYLLCYTDMDQMVSTRVAIPLYVPDELLSQLKSAKSKEIYQGVTIISVNNLWKMIPIP